MQNFIVCAVWRSLKILKCVNGEITTRLHTRHAKVSIVKVCALTSSKADQEKYEFYDFLQDTINDIPRFDIKIDMLWLKCLNWPKQVEL